MAKNKAVDTNVNTDENAVVTPEQQAILDASAALEAARATLKAAKEAAKGDKAKRELKGILVRFKNQKDEVIEGLGNLYYVVRQDGKLHYKAASEVTQLNEAEIAEYNEKHKK